MIHNIAFFLYIYFCWMAVFAVFLTLNILIEGDKTEIIYNLKCDLVLAIVLLILHKLTK